MENVLQYELPVLHPIAVHFPIALLIAAFAVGVPWFVTGLGFWRNVMAVLSVLGSVGAAVAYLTGEAMEEASEGTPIVEEIVEFHETLALITLIVSIAAAVAALVAVRLGRQGPRPTDSATMRAAVFTLVAAAAVLVAITGHAGGVMVWGVAR